jgi:hypothetical protein
MFDNAGVTGDTLSPWPDSCHPEVEVEGSAPSFFSGSANHGTPAANLDFFDVKERKAGKEDVGFFTSFEAPLCAKSRVDGKGKVTARLRWNFGSWVRGAFQFVREIALPEFATIPRRSWALGKRKATCD